MSKFTGSLRILVWCWPGRRRPGPLTSCKNVNRNHVTNRKTKISPAPREFFTQNRFFARVIRDQGVGPVQAGYPLAIPRATRPLSPDANSSQRTSSTQRSAPQIRAENARIENAARRNGGTLTAFVYCALALATKPSRPGGLQHSALARRMELPLQWMIFARS